MIEELKQFITTVSSELNITHLSTNTEVIDEVSFAQGQFPKKFANHINILIDIVSNHLFELSNQQKYSLIDNIIMSGQGFPRLLRKNPNRVQKIFDLICRVMANIPENVSETWFKPGNYSQDDLQKLEQVDPDSALVCKFRVFIDRMGAAMGFQKMIKLIENHAYMFYKDGDWRWKNAVLMCVSQLSEGVQIQQINNIMVLIKMGINQQHPKVRFAAAQALGQFADDLKPKFQQKYFNEFFPLIIQGFNDPVERVASHWLACMTNFIQYYEGTAQVLPYLSMIIEKLCYYIEKGGSLSKENAISTLSSMLTIPQLFDQETIKKPFQICHSILQIFPIQQYKQLINQTFQCLTIALGNQPYFIIKDYIQFTADLINQISDKLDIQYLAAGWHRLCSVEKKFENWGPIYAKVLASIKNMPLDQLKIGINSIQTTVICFGQDFNPFAAQTFEFLQNSLQQSIEAQQQTTASQAIDAIEQILIKAKPPVPDPTWDISVKQVISSYFKRINQIILDEMYDITQRLLSAIEGMLKNYIYLYTEAQLQDLSNYFWQLIKFLNENKKDIQMEIQMLDNAIENDGDNFENDAELDEELTKENRTAMIIKIDNNKLIIPDIIEIIMQKLADPSNLITKIMEHVNYVLATSQDDEDFRFVTYFVDNLLENYSYEMLKDYWNTIYNILLSFSTKSSVYLRNSAIYGFGIFTQKTPKELVTMQIILNWLNVSKNAFEFPKLSTEKDKEYYHCQDNCVVVVGKIIKRWNKDFDLRFLYDKWLAVLPLKQDKDQNKLQIDYLCQILQKQPQMLLDDQNIPQCISRLSRIFKIFGQFVRKLINRQHKVQNKQIISKVKETLLQIINWQIYKQNQQTLTINLNETEKSALKNLLLNSGAGNQ